MLIFEGVDWFVDDETREYVPADVWLPKYTFDLAFSHFKMLPAQDSRDRLLYELEGHGSIEVQ